MTDANQTADERRFGLPYVWAKWIAGLLSGEDQCKWKTWYRAHFRYEKIVESTEKRNRLSSWTADHADLVERRAAKLREDGWKVWTEAQNKHSVKGRAALVGMQADIVAVRDVTSSSTTRAFALDGLTAVARIEDVKTGKEREADFWQVVTYGVLYQIGRAELEGKVVVGAVVYGDGKIREIPSDVIALGRDRVTKMLAEMGSDVEPPRVPSSRECAFCDVAKCPSRIIEIEPSQATTEEF